MRVRFTGITGLTYYAMELPIFSGNSRFRTGLTLTFSINSEIPSLPLLENYLVYFNEWICKIWPHIQLRTFYIFNISYAFAIVWQFSTKN